MNWPYIKIMGNNTCVDEQQIIDEGLQGDPFILYLWSIKPLFSIQFLFICFILASRYYLTILPIFLDSFLYSFCPLFCAIIKYFLFCNSSPHPYKSALNCHSGYLRIWIWYYMHWSLVGSITYCNIMCYQYFS